MRLAKLSCLLLAGMETCAVPQLSSPTPTRHSNSSSSTTTSLRPRTTLATGYYSSAAILISRNAPISHLSQSSVGRHVESLAYCLTLDQMAPQGLPHARALTSRSKLLRRYGHHPHFMTFDPVHPNNRQPIYLIYLQDARCTRHQPLLSGRTCYQEAEEETRARESHHARYDARLHGIYRTDIPSPPRYPSILRCLAPGDQKHYDHFHLHYGRD